MVEYRTDEERVAAIVRFFDNYKTYIIWFSVGLILITIIFLSVNSYQTNQNYKAYSIYQKWVQIDPLDEDKDELTVFAFVRDTWNARNICDRLYPPYYLVQLMAKYYLNEWVHLLPSGCLTHVKIDVFDILSS